MKNNLTSFICFFLLITGCGFKLVNNSVEYQIAEINITGDKKINYFLKNKILLNSNEEGEKLLKLNINTTKLKTIKEKNISNQVTKYELRIDAQVEYTEIQNGATSKFSLAKKGFYDVSSSYSKTLNNEKNLISLLIDEMSKDITDKLSNTLNDL